MFEPESREKMHPQRGAETPFRHEDEVERPSPQAAKSRPGRAMDRVILETETRTYIAVTFLTMLEISEHAYAS